MVKAKTWKYLTSMGLLASHLAVASEGDKGIKDKRARQATSGGLAIASLIVFTLALLDKRNNK